MAHVFFGIIYIILVFSDSLNTLRINFRHQMPKYRLGIMDKWSLEYKYGPFSPFNQYDLHLPDYWIFKDDNNRISQYVYKEAKNYLKSHSYHKTTKLPEMNTLKKMSRKIPMSQSEHISQLLQSSIMDSLQYETPGLETKVTSENEIANRKISDYSTKDDTVVDYSHSEKEPYNAYHTYKAEQKGSINLNTQSTQKSISSITDSYNTLMDESDNEEKNPLKMNLSFGNFMQNKETGASGKDLRTSTIPPNLNHNILRTSNQKAEILNEQLLENTDKLSLNTEAKDLRSTSILDTQSTSEQNQTQSHAEQATSSETSTHLKQEIKSSNVVISTFFEVITTKHTAAVNSMNQTESNEDSPWTKNFIDIEKLNKLTTSFQNVSTEDNETQTYHTVTKQNTEITDESTSATSEFDSVEENSPTDEKNKISILPTIEPSTITPDIILSTADIQSKSNPILKTTKIVMPSITEDISPAASSSMVLETKSTTGFVSYTDINSINDKTEESSASETYPTTPEMKALSEEPEHIVKISSIKTAKMIVSVLFLVIALIATAALTIYFIRMKRGQVQYDQITLLP